MNIIDGKGTVHMPNSTGKYTVCRTLIRDHWQATEQPIGCPSCLNGRRPHGKAIGPAAEQLPQSISPDVAAMLVELGCRIIDELLVIQVLPDISGAVVTVRKAELREWCEKRLAARAQHKNSALKYLGGGSAKGYSEGVRSTYKV